MKCTWRECDKDATHKQQRSDGTVWAHLCSEHHKNLEAAIDPNAEDFTVGKMMGAWVKASGGAAKMAKEWK